MLDNEETYVRSKQDLDHPVEAFVYLAQLLVVRHLGEHSSHVTRHNLVEVLNDGINTLLKHLSLFHRRILLTENRIQIDFENELVEMA